MTPRAAAYETLIRCEKEKQYANLAINHIIQKLDLDKKERDFFTQLVYGVIEKKITLDYIVKQYTEKSPKRLDLPVLIILRLTFYQLFFLDRIPQSAAVSEGVNLASRYASRAKGYINAILRKACRETFSYPNDKNNALSYVLSVKYSVSEEIVSLLLTQYPDRIIQILEAISHTPYMTLQINTLRATPDIFLSNSHLNAQTLSIAPFAVRMKEHVSVSDMPFLKTGEAFVQDLASQLTTLLLTPGPDDTVVDVCACPGGKTFSAANFMCSQRQSEAEIKGSILSCDIHQSKLSLIQRGADRLGFSFIRTQCHDATIVMEDFRAKANCVICDVPCSGLGVIAKKPEIRYKPRHEIEQLPALQFEILKAAASYVKPGGTLVYSTCTINQNENYSVVERFLKDDPAFTIEKIPFPLDGLTYELHNDCLTLFPSDLHDGFFMAKLTKRKNPLP